MMRGSRVVRYSGLIVSFAALGVGCSSASGPSGRTVLGFSIATSPEIAELGFNRDWVTIVVRSAAGTDTLRGADFSGPPTVGRTELFPVPPGNVLIHFAIAPQDKVVGTADLVLPVSVLEFGERSVILDFSFGPKPNIEGCIPCKALEEVPFQESLLGLQSFWVTRFESFCGNPEIGCLT